MKIIKSNSPMAKPKINMLVYGMAGVGKTTFATTAPNPIIADAESGSKFLGIRGIKADIAQIEKWEDMQEFYKLVKDSKYETVVIDPIGELMDKLLNHLKSKSQYLQKNGEALTLQAWGVAKEKMRTMLKIFRDMDRNVICIAHAGEPKDEDVLLKRPKITGNLAEEIAGMMDIVGYMGSFKVNGKSERRIYVSPTEKFTAKDRTGMLPEFIEPDWDKMYEQILKGNKFADEKEIEKSNAKSEKEFMKGADMEDDLDIEDDIEDDMPNEKGDNK